MNIEDCSRTVLQQVPGQVPPTTIHVPDDVLGPLQCRRDDPDRAALRARAAAPAADAADVRHPPAVCYPIAAGAALVAAAADPAGVIEVTVQGVLVLRQQQ